MPLSCTHSELQKVPPLTQLRSYVTEREGGRVGAQRFCFSFCHSGCLTPRCGDTTPSCTSDGTDLQRCPLTIHWTQSPWQPDVGWKWAQDPSPNWTCTVNWFSSSFPPEANINLWGICFPPGVPLDKQGFLESTLASWHISVFPSVCGSTLPSLMV